MRAQTYSETCPPPLSSFLGKYARKIILHCRSVRVVLGPLSSIGGAVSNVVHSSLV